MRRTLLISSVASILASFIGTPACAQEVRSKTPSIEVLKVTFEEPFLNLVLFNNSDRGVRSVAVDVDGLVQRKTFWPPEGSGEFGSQKSFAFRYPAHTQPANVSVQAVTFADGWGEGDPKLLKCAFRAEEGYLRGVREARDLLKDTRPMLKSGHDSESLAWVSQTLAKLKERREGPKTYVTDEDLCKGSGRNAALLMVYSRLEAVERSFTRASENPGVISVRSRSGEAGMIAEKVGEIASRLTGGGGAAADPAGLGTTPTRSR